MTDESLNSEGKNSSTCDISPAMHKVLLEMLRFDYLDRLRQEYDKDKNLRSDTVVHDILYSFSAGLMQDKYFADRLEKINRGIRYVNEYYKHLDDIDKADTLAENGPRIDRHTVALKQGQTIEDAARQWERQRNHETQEMPVHDLDALVEAKEKSETIEKLKRLIKESKQDLNLKMIEFIRSYIMISSLLYTKGKSPNDVSDSHQFITAAQRRLRAANEQMYYLDERNKYLPLEPVNYDVKTHARVSKRHFGRDIDPSTTGLLPKVTEQQIRENLRE